MGELVQELEASQPTISKHLKVLREADLVSMRAQGQKRYYALNPKPLAGIASWLETFDVGPAARAEASPARLPDTRPQAAPDTLAAAATASCPGRVTASGRSARQPPGRQSAEPRRRHPGGLGRRGQAPQQIGRTVGRAATRAADLLANLPKFGRKK